MDRSVSGRILTPTGWVTGSLHFDDRIIGIDPGPAPADAPAILPGFIDLHVHGGGGADTMEGEVAVRRMASLHARHGTTSLLATTMTAERDDIDRALAGVRAVVEAPARGEASVLGVHLEGPFISPKKLGAQPDAARAAELETLLEWMAAAPIRVITLAPDMQGDDADRNAMITHLVGQGVRVQLGHSDCTYEAALAAFQSGAAGVTHLFNAMSALHHRTPGLAGAALAHAPHAELIPDLLHVHPGAIRAALRAIPGLYGVTDATAAAGMPDGDYRLGTQAVRKCRNGVRLADGTLAGSALTMDVALRRLVEVGLPLEDAARRLSTVPADYLGLTDRGRIVPGLRADLAVVGPDLALTHVFLGGEPTDVADG